MTSGAPVLVAGAGIGGLTAAICLMRADIPARVFEQAAVLGEIGAGIQVSANAGRVYRDIGLMDAIEAAGALPETYRFRMFDDGAVLQEIPLGEAYRARHGVPYVTIHRADLHSILVDAVHRLAVDAVRLGARVDDFTQDGAGIVLRLAGGETICGVALVGADGVKSTVRRLLIGDPPARYTGDAVWRAIVPAEALPPAYRDNAVDIWVGPGRHAVTYPLRGGRFVNFVGCVEHPGFEDESWTTAHPWEEMRDDFAGWHPRIGAIIEAADRGQCYRWALRIREPADNWSDGRVTLLGDAAHATLPYMAQGAAMAVEDAAVLARCLCAGDPVVDAIGRYQRNRIPRTTRIVNESTANRALFHLPDRQALRDAFARRDMNAERTAWLFSYDALTVPLD
ncbi:MAG: FAD-dependent monooxygenase [Rhizobiaceae bacterium]|nr:FAD-dependent monooxygenase [Rhizobiaceae bacterium]MCV0407931.1 FAD-dependent monooxygenase [Rhizobiaceae bacterium]